MRNTAQAAFTLLELLIVIALGALLICITASIAVKVVEEM